MKTSPWCLLALLFAVSPAAAELDFTVQHESMVADAIPVNGTYITDGNSRIYLRIMANWKVFNDAQTLECLPDTANSKLRLEHFSGPKLLTIDQAGARELQQLAATQILPDAKNVVALPPELNPLPLFGWNTLEVAHRYDYFGAPMRRSVMYVSMMPGRVVQLTVTAPDTDFDKVHKEARKFLGSWFEPSRDLPPDLQRKYKVPEAMAN